MRLLRPKRSFGFEGAGFDGLGSGIRTALAVEGLGRLRSAWMFALRGRAEGALHLALRGAMRIGRGGPCGSGRSPACDLVLETCAREEWRRCSCRRKGAMR